MNQARVKFRFSGYSLTASSMASIAVSYSLDLNACSLILIFLLFCRVGNDAGEKEGKYN